MTSAHHASHADERSSKVLMTKRAELILQARKIVFNYLATYAEVQGVNKFIKLYASAICLLDYVKNIKLSLRVYLNALDALRAGTSLKKNLYDLTLSEDDIVPSEKYIHKTWEILLANSAKPTALVKIVHKLMWHTIVTDTSSVFTRFMSIMEYLTYRVRPSKWRNLKIAVLRDACAIFKSSEFADQVILPIKDAANYGLEGIVSRVPGGLITRPLNKEMVELRINPNVRHFLSDTRDTGVTYLPPELKIVVEALLARADELVPLIETAVSNEQLAKDVKVQEPTTVTPTL